jgi:glycosyltransferase involved in cell wall biosynthesis
VSPAPERQAGPPRVEMVVRLFAPWVGGTERQAHTLARALAKRGVKVEIVTGWWFRRTRRRETLDGIPVFRNQTLWEFGGVKGLRKLGGYLYIGSLLWYLWRRRNRYDVIHVHGLNYHTFAAVLAARWLNKKTITKLANSGKASDIEKMRQDRQLVFARFMLPTALRCDRFVALNETIVQELVEAGVPRSRIVRLSNGVDLDGIDPRRQPTLHRPPRVVFVGRLHRQKGLDTLLRALRVLMDDRQGDGVRLVLVGDGPEREALEQLSLGLGVDEIVDFVGIVDDVAPYLKDADIFVLPSHAEGLSNALLEAMAFGIPVIVSNVPGNTDAVEDNRTGLIFEVGDAPALAAGIARLLDDSDLRERLGRAARESVEESYSLAAVAGRYIELYDELLDLERGDRSDGATRGEITGE